MTEKDFAAEMNISYGYLNKILLGRRPAGRKAATKIAAKLNVNIAALIHAVPYKRELSKARKAIKDL